MDDREMLIRVEQQMIDAAKNQATIMSDLKEIFNRIESESKISAQLKGDLKAYIDISTLRIADMDHRMADVSQILKELQVEFKKKKDERNTFQSEINGSLKTFKWIFSILGAIAVFLNIVLVIMPKLVH